MIYSACNTLFASLTYRVDTLLVDPGDTWEGFNNIQSVLLTHAHLDHIYGLNELFRISPEAKVYTNEYGRVMLLDAKKNMSFYHETPFVFNHPERIVIVEDGDEIDLGDRTVAKAIFTPGHNPSCITWVIDDNIFTGDAYIPGLKTVTNLPGGNRQQAAESIDLIKRLAIGKRICPMLRMPL